MDALNGQSEQSVEITSLQLGAAVSVPERNPVLEGMRIDKTAASEHRSRYEVRSMSMPVIKGTTGGSSAKAINTELPHKCKDRQDLRLPSFKALGIAVPHPDHLLTPPEEPDYVAWHPLSQPLPERQDYEPLQGFSRPTAGMTPEDDQNMAVPLDSEGINSEYSAAATLGSLDIAEEDDTAGRPNSSSSEEESAGGPVWIEHAIDAVGRSSSSILKEGDHSY